MDLISRKAAIKIAEKYSLSKGTTIGKHSGVAEIIADKVAELPSVPAVPLDKLCEWLAGNAWHLDCSDCDGEHCDCPQLYDDSGGSPEFWKTKLTKWMEENK